MLQHQSLKILFSVAMYSVIDQSSILYFRQWTNQLLLLPFISTSKHSTVTLFSKNNKLVSILINEHVSIYLGSKRNSLREYKEERLRIQCSEIVNVTNI